MMTPELTVLALAGLLQGIQFVLMSVPANIELGPKVTTSPRDPQRLGQPLEQMVSVKTGRLFRALNNHFEALILFTIAVVVVTLGDKSTGLSAACAWTYLAARVLYIPAYYFGWRPWRSYIWMVGFLATMVMIASSFVA